MVQVKTWLQRKLGGQTKNKLGRISADIQSLRSRILLELKTRILIKPVGNTRVDLGGIVDNETQDQKNEPRGFPLKSLKHVGDMSKIKGH